MRARKRVILFLLLLLVSILAAGCKKEEKEEQEEKRIPDKLVIETNDKEESKEEEVPEPEVKTTKLRADTTELKTQIEAIVQQENANGNGISVYIEDLSSEEAISVSEHQMQAASLIKFYIAGSVFEKLNQVKLYDTYQGETESLVREMIRVSDNNAANELVRRLGNGDTTAGRGVVNSYCADHGYTSSHMGRLLLESNAYDDNYTSAADCAKFMKAVYNDTIPGAQNILSYMKAQERTGKIPAGVPAGVETANKTGELADVENDAAIIMTDKGAYTVCVMMEDLTAPGYAQETIIHISSVVYQYLTE